jgi:nucleotide-binding universal stress UspA family protein
MFVLGADTINPLLLNPIGIAIAIFFLASIVGVLGWMLRLPKETERTHTATKAVRSVNKLTRILVPLLKKNETTDRTVALAAQMARHRNGNVEVLAVIEVSFMLPLDAKVEEDEKYALELLDRAESVAMQSATKVKKRILKARNAGAAIVREAEEKAVDLIIIANTPVRVRGNMQQIDPVVEYVMRNAPCEVLVLSHIHTGDAQTRVRETEKEGTGAAAAGATR